MRFLKWLVAVFINGADRIQFRMARAKAIRLHEMTRKEYRVFKLNNRYWVLHSSQIKQMQKTGVIQKRLGYVELDKYCCYTTLQLKKKNK